MLSSSSARRGVLAVGDHQVDLALRDNIRQPVLHHPPAGRTHNVSDEKYAHEKGADCSAVEN
jgi:hypothetical protein